jgi:hypothetical protein
MKGGFTGGFPARRAAGRPYPAPGRGLPVLASVQRVLITRCRGASIFIAM